MTNTRIELVLDGPPHEGIEAEIRFKFSEGHFKRGFGLLRKLSSEESQIHLFTIYTITKSFKGDERLGLLRKLSDSIMFGLPLVMKYYINFLEYSYNSDMDGIQSTFRKLKEFKFPADILVKNLYADFHFNWVISLSLWKKCPKGVDILVLRMNSYMALHKWNLAEETAKKILLSDKQNIPAICILARFSISEGDYIGALKSLENAENIDTDNEEVQLLKLKSLNYLKQLQKANVPKRRPEDILIDKSDYVLKSGSVYNELNLISKANFNKYLIKAKARNIKKNNSSNSFDTLIFTKGVNSNSSNEDSNLMSFFLGMSSKSRKRKQIFISKENFTFLYFLALECHSSIGQTKSPKEYWTYDSLNHMDALIESYENINEDFRDILDKIEESNSVLYEKFTSGLEGEELVLNRRLVYRKIGGRWPLDRDNKIKKTHSSQINSAIRKPFNNNRDVNLIRMPRGSQGMGGIYTLSKNISIIKFTSE
ncbi:hypothetical protein E3V36_04520 [Candidatus Marinimicrobia bacterium MT.SAG.2]|nr:hypothetical protein E3V36_04520 [Candidatus Marinimicrobia bacterium MT.SAG.2]